jgi:hypothetical protein
MNEAGKRGEAYRSGRKTPRRESARSEDVARVTGAGTQAVAGHALNAAEVICRSDEIPRGLRVSSDQAA